MVPVLQHLANSMLSFLVTDELECHPNLPQMPPTFDAPLDPPLIFPWLALEKIDDCKYQMKNAPHTN